ncbi:hypothetical protein CALVIDRAFT_542597 [Calocera viscosa TUFC12733]|uniref:Uncharacterized protein n=1 Tax=Calocera viscosa (strain TUFC12733) TaxID=1330018 RepID=A0A167GHG5_CALVF|nr:hypothetical protein CALVIDRAFT_542597 [Calocera viscosa TUFC12733]
MSAIAQEVEDHEALRLDMEVRLRSMRVFRPFVPSLPDRRWDVAILRSWQSFLQIPGRVEHDYYGLINMCLTQIFPISDGWRVHPQAGPEFGRKESANWLVFDVEYAFDGIDTRPARLVWEAKPLNTFDRVSKLGSTDIQIRERLADVGNTMDLPVLFGVSSIGQWLQLYTYTDTGDYWPPRPIPRNPNPNYVRDDWPNDWHTTNLFHPAGHDLLVKIREEILFQVGTVYGQAATTPSPDMKDRILEQLAEMEQGQPAPHRH